MKTKNLILFFGILLLSFGCSNNDDLSESDKEENSGNNNRENITGQWKLVADSILTFKNGTLSEVKHNNYSDKNIIYDFQEGDILLIEGTSTDYLYKEGQHTYQYKKLNVCPTCLPSPNLLIDGKRSFCIISNDDQKMNIEWDEVTENIDEGVKISYSLAFAKF